LNRQKFISEMGSTICLKEKDRRRIIRHSVLDRSKNTNCTLAIEEMSELTQQLTKHIRGIGDYMGTVEELADVHLSLEVIEQALEIDPVQLRKAMDIKLRREQERRTNDKADSID